MLKRSVMIAAGMVMVCQGNIVAQSLLGPRALAVGAYGPLVNDTRDFGMNPAGLTHLQEWEFTATSYLPTTGPAEGFVFHGLTVGRGFAGSHAAALQFSNGTALEFIFPAQSIVVGSEPTTVDTRISYSEKFSAAYAYGPSDQISAGVLARYRREKVTDTRYQFVDTTIVRLPDLAQETGYWAFDLGARWSPRHDLSFSVVGRNLLTSGKADFDEGFAQYQLDSDPAIGLGVSYATGPILLALEGTSVKEGALGVEWSPAQGVAARTGLHFSDQETQFLNALSVGLGWDFEFLRADAGYLHFFDDETHSGTINEDQFIPGSVTNLDMNPYAPGRFSLSVAARLGVEREVSARIDRVEIREAVYPALREVFAYRPLGTVSVTNVSESPINVRAEFFLENLMDEPTQSQPFYVVPGQQVEIPLTATFNDRLGAVTRMAVRDATVSVRVSAEGVDDWYQTRVIVQGKNAWDGEVESLRYFVTPDEPDIIRYTRDVLVEHRSKLVVENTDLETFQKVRVLIDNFAGRLLYVNDPKLSADVVQYPAETLDLRGGDCDDMTVLLSSLLNSIGVSTAFVDVVPTGRPEGGHVYLMFDSGVSPERAAAISENPKRYTIRKGPEGRESVWIPVETTEIMKGFEQAWSVGAREYFDDVEIGLGLVQGWVRIVDVY